MKLSNFEVMAQSGCTVFAGVDVAQGMLWWRKTTRRLLCRMDFEWHFADTGRPAPGAQADRLHDAWCMRELFRISRKETS